jgi:hypothetical protein
MWHSLSTKPEVGVGSCALLNYGIFNTHFCHYQLHDTSQWLFLPWRWRRYILRNVNWFSLEYTALNFRTQPYLITVNLHMHQLLGSSISLQLMVAGALSWKLTFLCLSIYVRHFAAVNYLIRWAHRVLPCVFTMEKFSTATPMGSLGLNFAAMQVFY